MYVGFSASLFSALAVRRGDAINGLHDFYHNTDTKIATVNRT